MAIPGIKTDWDSYYLKTASTAKITRKITTEYLIRAFKCYDGDLSQAEILEWGGANSCFYERLQRRLSPKNYFIADSNELGLKKFFETFPSAKNVKTFQADVLDEGLASLPTVDICYSVGLIEHFDTIGTRQAIANHFNRVRPGGLVILSFPTPTAAYRATRGLLEYLNLWGFPDERPLKFDEVITEAKVHGEVIYKTLNWPILLTQGLVVVKVKP